MLDFKLTGRRFSTTRNTYNDEFDESAYMQMMLDSQSLPSREIAESETNRLMRHCADWGMGVHSGIRSTLASKRLGSYENPTMRRICLIFIPWQRHLYIEFEILGTVLSRNCNNPRILQMRLFCRLLFATKKTCFFLQVSQIVPSSS